MFSSKSITKSEEIITLLTCQRLPGRLTTGQAAVILGFSENEIAILIASRLLEPLGRPAPNAPKYFASSDISEKAGNPDWLGKATRAVTNHWRTKNQRKSQQVL